MKNTYQIQLTSQEDMLDFVREATKCEFNIDILKGHYIIDAKSIIGVMSLDTTNGTSIYLHTNEEKEIEGFICRVKNFIVE